MKKPAVDISVLSAFKDTLGECPMWHPVEQILYWVDTRAPAIRRMNKDGVIESRDMPTNIGSFVFREKGGMVVALKTGFHFFDFDSSKLEFIDHPEKANPENRLNDGRCDRMGRFWCGSRDPGYECAGGSLFTLYPDLKVQKKDEGFIVSNGMAFSPDDRTLTFGDSRGDTIWNYDLDMSTGEITNKRVYIDTSGLPWRVDGATYDADGYYWAALIGGGCVGRFDPAGRLVRLIRLPVTYPTMCNFGGPGMEVLYVTTAKIFHNDDQLRAEPLSGSIFAITGHGTRGVSEPLFKG